MALVGGGALEEARPSFSLACVGFRPTAPVAKSMGSVIPRLAAERIGEALHAAIDRRRLIRKDGAATWTGTGFGLPERDVDRLQLVRA